nr:hypothetical protein BaRGS_004430 [Batillaria attramentaria]
MMIVNLLLCQLFKFDGATCDELGEIGSPAHRGGIYDLCFSPDDKQVLTVSGDKTAKIFDVESGQLVQEFVMGSKDWQDMQLGCLWQGSNIITVNARGHIIYHSQETPQQPLRVIKGHMKPVTAMVLSEDKSMIFTGGQEGIIWWDVATGQNDVFGGQGHTNEVTDMAVDGDKIVSVGKDDRVHFSSVSAKQFSGGEIVLDSQPKAVDARNGMVVVACIKHLVVLEGNRQLTSIPTKAEAASVSFHPGGSTVAVAFKDCKVRIYSLQSGALSETKELKIEKEPTVLAYSPDGAYLSVSSDRSVSLFSATDYGELSNGQPHTARVTCLSWAPDSSRFVTGSIDCRAVVWNDMLKSIVDRPAVKAHTMSYPNKIAWINNNTFVSAGQDSNVKIFTISD